MTIRRHHRAIASRTLAIVAAIMLAAGCRGAGEQDATTTDGPGDHDARHATHAEHAMHAGHGMHGGHGMGASAPDDRGDTATKGNDIAYYTCSMHPSVRTQDPGQCPICGMDLVAVSRADVESGTVRVDAERRQRFGITTAPAERRPVTIDVRTVGRVTYDEARLADVTLKVRGWIGEVFADTTGMEVESGSPLFTVYSPELLSAQEEFLESGRRGGAGRLRETARRRLRLWDLTAGQITSLAERGRAWEHVPILAPLSGTVIEKHVVTGTAVEAGTRLYRLADLSAVWIEADVYEDDLPLVEPGMPAEVTLSYLPETRLTATVTFVYPYLDAATRTGRIRLEVPNPDGALKPDMYADVTLAVPIGERLVVPEGAVVRAGATNVVFVDQGDGRLAPRTVDIGRTSDGHVVLQGGVAAGEVVVTSGTFLIAAESKLRAGIEKW